MTPLKPLRNPNPAPCDRRIASLGAIALAALVLCEGCVSNPRGLRSVGDSLDDRSGFRLVERTNAFETILPTEVEIDDGLSSSEAVLIALLNNRELRAQLAHLGFNRADLIQAGELPNPTLGMLFPTGPDQWELTLTFPIEAFLLRPKRVAIAGKEHERAALTLVQTGLDFIRDVRAGYIDLYTAERRAGVMSEAAALQDRILELENARYRHGDISAMETSVARVKALELREAHRRLVEEAKGERERFRNLLGLAFSETTFSLPDWGAPPSVPSSVEALEQLALKDRPDFLASRLAMETAGERIGLAKLDIVKLSAVLELDRVKSGEEYELAGKPGLDLELPVFHRNQSGVLRARTAFERAMFQNAALRDRIALEVRRAYQEAQQHIESLRQWRVEILPVLSESEQFAESAFNAGEVGPITVLERTQALAEARLTALEIESKLRKAIVELERSVGYKLQSNDPLVATQNE